MKLADLNSLQIVIKDIVTSEDFSVVYDNIKLLCWVEHGVKSFVYSECKLPHKLVIQEHTKGHKLIVYVNFADNEHIKPPTKMYYSSYARVPWWWFNPITNILFSMHMFEDDKIADWLKTGTILVYWYEVLPQA